MRGAPVKVAPFLQDDRLILTLPAGESNAPVRLTRTDDQPGVDIEVKMHVPGSWLGDTDTKIIESLSAWFEKNGHPEFASSYGSEVAAAL
jgi:hypothetical protein